MGNGLLEKIRALVAAASVLGVAIACSSNKNHDERALVAEARPFQCVDLCQPDPGSGPVDCDAEERHDLFEYVSIWDFDAQIAQYMYIYDDKSVCQPGTGCDESSSFRVPDDGYEPPTEATERCGAPNQAFHISGGPFLSWGGGFGRRIAGAAAIAASCDGDDCEADPEFPNDTINLSEWEGFSFWARRGPDSQAGIRIGIGDKYTDDDLSFISYLEDPSKPRHCERNLECGCRSKPCSPYEHPGSTVGPRYYCWDPAVDPVPVFEPGTTNTQYDMCGETMCNAGYPAFEQPFRVPNATPNFCDANPALCKACENSSGSTTASDCRGDPQFYGKQCTYYEFRGSLAGSYCFNPGEDPEPFEGNQICGDLWVKAVNLTTDWQFYRVPFRELLQQGWAKESHLLDLTAASMMRFTFDRGWIDYWIDDVSFYRKRPSP